VLSVPGFTVGVARLGRADFDQAVAGRGIEIEVIELLEIANASERRRPKRAFSFENMKDDAFEEVAKGEVMVLGEGFQYLEDALFDPDTGLGSFDLQFMVFHVVTYVPEYMGNCQS
jgi:hypothetical protein